MSTTIPLIRGFALYPMLRWLTDNSVSADQALEMSGLSPNLVAEPFRPVPLVHVAEMLRSASRKFGPDLPCRIVSSTGNIEIAMLGKVATGTRTPREALTRILAALPHYCSHEQVTVEKKAGKYVVRHFFACRFDPETRHVLLQYAAAMVDRVLAMAGSQRPRFQRLAIPPHPTVGVQHLYNWFGTAVIEARSKGFVADIDELVMDRAFNGIGRDRLRPRDLRDFLPLRGDGCLSSSVKSHLISMIECKQIPNMKDTVHVSGLSERSFQRQLETEGTSFSVLLADVRHSEVLKRLEERNSTIAAIAADFGYSDQASFTRAFRRRTGAPPGRFRDGATRLLNVDEG